jgi:protein SCO1
LRSRFAFDPYQGTPSGVPKTPATRSASAAAVLVNQRPAANAVHGYAFLAASLKRCSDTNPFSQPGLCKTALAMVLLLFCIAASLSCTKHASSTPPVKRYPFTGRIVSLDKPNQTAVIDGDMVQGFMEAMQMSYKIKDTGEFGQLAPGDSVSAQVVVVDTQDKDAVPDYWLENVKVTGHATQPTAKPTAQQRIPTPGEDVPDFHFTNQNSRHISLKQYRGQVVFVTFIYTRCPFPDYCPRIGAQFAQLRRQLDADAALSGKTHLLCISFDPVHDTPKALRDYGFSLLHSHNSALFNGWEFAVPRAADLAQIADYFGLIYKPENGLITHSLSTTVIGPDGKIINWYEGSDWQALDLIKDATGALHAQG